MLFTDGPVSSIEDLAAYDSQLLNVAAVENIDVTRKMALAQSEIGLELHSMLDRQRRLTWLTLPPRIDQVVVTPALQLWHAYRSLEMVYSDAYNSQLNDRYAGKRDQFHERARYAREKLVQTGLGIALIPIPRAATPDVIAAQGSLPDGTYYVSMAWANAAGEEGAAAIPAVFTTSMSTLLVEPGPAPKNAAGWNVYAGIDPNALALQNASPIAIGQTWVQPAVLATGGRAPGDGQAPAFIQPVPRVIQRG